MFRSWNIHFCVFTVLLSLLVLRCVDVGRSVVSILVLVLVNPHLAIRVVGQLKSSRQKQIWRKLNWIRMLESERFEVRSEQLTQIMILRDISRHCSLK